MEEELIGIKNAALSLILESSDLKNLEDLKLQFLGRSGKLTLLIKDIPKLPVEQRPEIGQLANEIKRILEESITDRELGIRNLESRIRKEKIDITAPGIPPKIGHLHPMTQVLYEVVDIFKKIGFEVAEGPEIETDYYNFEALNIPKDHPSRDTQQTLYLDTRNSKKDAGETILRTQTSNMQIRIMEKISPPIRVIAPGKVFRYEQTDASHGFEFWQFEGFAVGKNITFSDLLGTLDYFVKKFFGEDTKIRFISHNFPFTEPSLEGYISCTVCKEKGCSFCKYSGWVEALGGGMIHPKVLEAVKIDYSKFQGFAFGTGLSRLVTLRYQMGDLRLLTNPDLRILEQF